MQPQSFTPEQLFAHSRPQGVTRIVLIQMSFYGYDNSYMLDCMRRFPGVFSGVAVIDPSVDRPDAAMQGLVAQGVRGFRVRGIDAPREDWLETPGYERMFDCAAELQVAICPLVEPSALSSVARMCARHLNTPVVIDHFARIGVDGELRERDIHALVELAHFPRVCVKLSAYYALGTRKAPHREMEPLIRRLHAAYGSERLMWASDCPFQVDAHRYEDSIAVIRDGCPWLSAKDRRRILRETAERVYFRSAA